LDQLDPAMRQRLMCDVVQPQMQRLAEAPHHGFLPVSHGVLPLPKVVPNTLERGLHEVVPNLGWVPPRRSLRLAESYGQ
jgi:hypothetical protein